MNYLTILIAGISFATQATAASDLESGLDELATQIVSQASDGSEVTIAVSPFRHTNDLCSEMSNFIADELIYSLLVNGQGRVNIVERSQLQSIFEELEFNLSGAVDTQTAKQLGNLYGVDALVLGSINTLGSQLRLTSRMVDTGTGTVQSAARTSVPITDEVNELMDERLRFPCARNTQKTDNRAEGTTGVAFPIGSIPDISSLEGRWIGRSSCDGTFSFSATSLSTVEVALADERYPNDATGKIFFEAVTEDSQVQVAFHQTNNRSFAMRGGQKLIVKSYQELVSPEDSRCHISLIRSDGSKEDE